VPDGSNLTKAELEEFDDAPYNRMSPTLLAQMEAVPSDLIRQPLEWWNTYYYHLEARMAQMRSWRFSWWWAWQDLAAFFCPKRYKFFITANQMVRGRPLNDQIVDSTGVYAVNICYTGMWSGLTPPTKSWWRPNIALPWVAPDAAAKAWLQDLKERTDTVLQLSNFYTEMAQFFQDVTVFGTAVMIIYEDIEDGIRCYVPCAGEYFLGTSGRMANDTMYREYTLTVYQIVDMFKLKNCPQQVVSLWNQAGASLENEFVVCHAIEPNFGLSKRGAGQDDLVYDIP
jgi:hypothetical protein